MSNLLLDEKIVYWPSKEGEQTGNKDANVYHYFKSYQLQS